MWCFRKAFETAKEMSQRDDGVFIRHSGTGVAHNLTDFLPHLRLITMDRAFRAAAFFFAEGTAFETPGGIAQKRLTVVAQDFLRPVPAGAIHGDHAFKRRLFL